MTVSDLVDELLSHGKSGDGVYVKLSGGAHAITGVEIEGDLEGNAWLVIEVESAPVSDGVTL